MEPPGDVVGCTPKPYELLESMTDEDLLAEYSRGDDRYAPEVLLKRYYEKLMRFVIKLCPRAANEAGEIAEDAFLEALNQRSDDDSLFRVTVYARTRYRTIDYARRTRVDLQTLTSLSAARDGDHSHDVRGTLMTDAILREREILEAVELCRTRLSPVENRIVTLKIEGFNFTEMGRIQGRTAESCRQAWGRAVEKLNNCLRMRLGDSVGDML